MNHSHSSNSACLLQTFTLLEMLTQIPLAISVRFYDLFPGGPDRAFRVYSAELAQLGGKNLIKDVILG